LIALLNPLVANKVYWDSTPEAFVIPVTGVIILQQIGGKAGRYVANDEKPDHKHARIQVTFWTPNQLIRGPVARDIEDAMVMSAFSAEPMGAATHIADTALKLFGSQQQFGFWYADP
jgi:hypothetical protein